MKNSNHLNYLWGGIILLIILSILVVFIPGNKFFSNQGSGDISAWFFGICQVILLSGLLLYAFCLTKIWFKHLVSCQTQKEKDKENALRQTQLQGDINQRKAYELERDRVNDLFRMIEISKSKPEVVEKFTDVEEQSNPLKTTHVKESNSKSDELDISRVAELMVVYKKAILKQ